MSQQTAQPWGLRRMQPFAPLDGTAEYTRVELDPATQTGRYLDAHGAAVETAGHGTNRPVYTRTQAPSQDGGGGKPPTPGQPDSDTGYQPD